MSQVFVEVRGGNVVAAYSDDGGLSVHVIDWDNMVEQPDTEDFLYPCDTLSDMPLDTRRLVGFPC